MSPCTSASGRLVVQHQLSAGERGAEFFDEGEVAAAVGVPRGVVEGDAGARALGVVHGDVRLAQQSGGGLRAVVQDAGRGGDSHAGPGVDDQALDGERVGEPVVESPAQQECGVFERSVGVHGREHRELVAAETPEHVAGAEHRLQPRRHHAQQVVSGRVAEGVVHLLELVQVE
jgi:hypothetical protein